MLTEICQELKNYFDRDQPKYYGDFEIEDGGLVLRSDMSLKDGQYFRIVGSALNDGVYQYPSEDLADETFTGAVWAMAIPPSVVAISNEIDAWIAKYGDINHPAMSPYTSESFGGYSYSKSSGSNSSGSGSTGVNWQSVFGKRLNMWRKILL